MSRWIVLLVLCGALGAGAWFEFVREDVHGSLGTKLRYDDFDFTAVSSREVADLVDGKLKPRGAFRVVELKVENQAKRVDYSTSQHRAILFDERGERIEADLAAMKAFEESLAPSARPPALLHAGESTVQTWIFDVPKGAKCELGISWGGAVVDLLDWAVLGKWRIALP